MNDNELISEQISGDSTEGPYERQSRHSEQIDEIITKPPAWITKWGMLIFTGILMFGVSISAIIRYPEVVKSGIKVQYINNSISTKMIGIIEISQANLSKIQMGQTVIFSLEVYPSEEYGQLKGEIFYVADDPDPNGHFVVKTTIDSNSLNPKMKLRDWMTGNASIITRDATILQRIVNSLGR